MNLSNYKIIGNIVDIKNQHIYYGEIEILETTIKCITKLDAEKPNEPYIIPGFIDAHVHIESSMLVPAEFARMAVVHGTVATISDPHEIANVCGMPGVEFMIENGKTVPFKFYFGAPSCVPATIFETAGAEITVENVEALLQRPEIKYLSEMMNFPGVLFKDKAVMQKIAAAHKANKPVDGHAPGLRGQDAANYIAALNHPVDGWGATDHECFTKEEALDKLQHGMKILIREGSAAKNFEALIELLNDYPTMMMFCSDDKHPDSLEIGHINKLCTRAVAKGIDVFKVLQAACINPVKHYQLEVGQLQINDAADFVIVNNLTDFKVIKTFINGELVAENGKSFIQYKSWEKPVLNSFEASEINLTDLKVNYTGQQTINVIEALDGQLITNWIKVKPLVINNEIVSDTENDVLKIVVINRYSKAPVAKAFIKNFGLKQGALASTVAHDSHNIIAVGSTDEALITCIQALMQSHGGICACNSNIQLQQIALPVAGLMTMHDGYAVSKAYTALDEFTKTELGSTLASPFMTLSFMALLVIPQLKLSDKGLFDGAKFEFV